MNKLLSFFRLKSPGRLLVSGLIIVAGIICTQQLVFASGETITGGSAVTGQINVAAPISDIQIAGSDNSVVPVKLRVTSGTLQMTTTTGLTFAGASTGASIEFSGTRSNVNTALATLQYTRSSLGTDTLEVSLVASGEVFFPDNGHLYEYVSATNTWGNARTAAAGRTKYGATGYLTTITSQAENEFVSARLSDAGWMGGSDSVSEGAWRWVTGPETNTQFWQGLSNGGAVGGNYANWNSGEPNDSGSNEDCGQFLAGSSGKWNDLPCSSTTLPGYVVEYGASGNMPTVAAQNVSITISDAVAPTTPGTPSTTSPTTTQRPVWTWTASTDSGGAGLANPAYSVQWSQSSGFASGVSSSTTNSTSFTQPSNLADGTWYFRVRASDTASNTSSYAPSSVVIDTTVPTTPGLTATTVQTRVTTPTISWSASTDSGVGLASPAYTVQWATNTGFSTQLHSSTLNDTALEVPSALTEGTWYFRVAATDQLTQQSAWSSTLTIVVDTTVPTTPGQPATSSPTNNQKPTWTWAVSTDASVGLGNPAYTIEWSQSSSFSSGGITGTSNTASFTQPSNLTNGTWYVRILASDAVGNNSSYSVVGSVTIDTTTPTLSNILASAETDTSERVIWATDKLSSSRIAYGPTSAYDMITSESNLSPRVTSHSVLLDGLIACTLYHYQITSIDALGNQTTSADVTFITSGCAGSAVVAAHAETTITTVSGGDMAFTSTTGNTVSLTVPANFSGSDADFQIKQLDTSAALAILGTPGALVAVGGLYDLKAMESTDTPITSFTNPVEVSMSYTPASITDLVEQSLHIYRWDAGIGWQRLDACSVDVSTRIVTCTTPGFSIFALFGSAIVAEPAAPQTQTTTPTKQAKNIPVTEPTVLASEEPPVDATITAPPSESGASVDSSEATTHAAGKQQSPLRIFFISLFILFCFLLLLAFRRRKRRSDEQESALHK